MPLGRLESKERNIKEENKIIMMQTKMVAPSATSTESW